MPKKFDVIVTRDMTESVTVEVTAIDGPTASSQALNQVKENPDAFAWSSDYTPNASANLYVTDVSAQ